jgi:hypothetical protein
MARDILHELHCPKCMRACLSHVAGYGREQEDREHGRNVPAPIGGNTSERRDGISVLLECKTCGGRATLCIAQHKGCTQLFWR